MRIVVAMVVIVGMLTVLVGTLAIRGDGPFDPDESNPDSASQGSNAQAGVVATPDPSGGIFVNPTPQGDPDPEIDSPDSDLPVDSIDHDIRVQKPELTNYTENITRVREHYAERFTYGTITVAWRPGTFPPERAAYVADTTARLLGEANARLQTNFYPEMEIFLADQLYAPECLGCQGFAAADLFQIFILQDGSLAPDEFEALLLHEIVHVIAAHEIWLPHSLFFAEGLATWAMTDYLMESGYLSPLQTAAWAYEAGVMPSLENLRKDDYAGRVRKRVEYDGAASFAFFIIDTYGYDAYLQMYTLDPPDMVINKTWNELEVEWIAYLQQWTGNTVDGVDAHRWWAGMSRVIDGFAALYTNPAPVSAEQYEELVRARLAINRGDVETANEAINASGLVQRTAQ